MGNELIWYILIGVIYLIFGLRKRRPKQPGTRPRAVPFEEALRELTAAASDGAPHANSPAVRPAPPPAQAMVAESRPWSNEFVARSPIFFDDPFAAAPTLLADQATAPLTVKRISPAHSPESQGAAIAKQLQDPQTARTAVVLSEVLGKPRALR